MAEMNNRREEVLKEIEKARRALGRAADSAGLGSGEDIGLERIVASDLLSAESHIWNASARLTRLIKEGE